MKILGISDEVTTCGCCGRTDLKKTVAIDTGSDIVRYGEICAARALGRSLRAVKQEVKAATETANAAVARERQAQADAEFARWSAWLNLQVPGADVATAIRTLGGFAAARAAYRGA